MRQEHEPYGKIASSMERGMTKCGKDFPDVGDLSEHGEGNG